MTSGKQRKRLDEALVARDFFDDPAVARGWIMAGKVLVDGAVCSKPGTRVKEDAEINVRGVVQKYVSRGGYKLEAALDRFQIAVEGKTVLDAGASTGGFSDCLLQRGAARVYAVDVGFGQLRGKIAVNPRVVNLERTNIGDLTIDRFSVPIDLCVFDLSYLSCIEAAPLLARLFRGPVEMVGLIKPLFEGLPQDRIDDPEALHSALGRVLTELPRRGLQVDRLTLSPILGNRGTVEFLAHLREGTRQPPDPALCDQVITELRENPPRPVAAG